MLTVITTENQYNEALALIETFVQKGTNAMSPEDDEEFLRLALLVEAYEQKVAPMPLPPQSLVGMIQIKMFERRMRQKELAMLLEVSETTLSEVLNGKRKVNLDLAKKLYKKLGISSDFILESA